jgi:hypothetical protein
MSPMPSQPKIYHITHGNNIPKIVADGCLWSDAEIVGRGGPTAAVGISEIKARRLHELSVLCRPGTRVGEYVPFYFCPRSVMLYILHKRNHPDLAYKGGQRPMLHLEADLHEVVAWAEREGRWWAFTDTNAGSRYFQSFCDLGDLSRLDWGHIDATDFRHPLVKEAKQAEFLIHHSFPWSLVQSIGVKDDEVATWLRRVTAVSDHRPDVRVEPSWYYDD